MSGVIGVSWAVLPSHLAFLVTIMGIILGVLSILLGWRGDKLIREMKEMVKEWREDTNMRLA